MFGLSSITEKIEAVIIALLVVTILVMDILLWKDKTRIYTLTAEVSKKDTVIAGLKNRNDDLIKLRETAADDAASLRVELSKRVQVIRTVKLTGVECDDLKSVVDAARSVGTVSK